jgi:hypothetical protein
LEALRVPLTVPLAPDETAARMLLDRRPPVVLRTVDLEHAASSARRARLFVSAACDDWQLDMIRDDAMVVGRSSSQTPCCTRAPPVGWRCAVGNTD